MRQILAHRNLAVLAAKWSPVTALLTATASLVGHRHRNGLADRRVPRVLPVAHTAPGPGRGNGVAIRHEMRDDAVMRQWAQARLDYRDPHIEEQV